MLYHVAVELQRGKYVEFGSLKRRSPDPVDSSAGLVTATIDSEVLLVSPANLACR